MKKTDSNTCSLHCLEPETNREAHIVQTLGGKYQFIERLGQSSTSAVYAVKNKSLDRTEALKVFINERLCDNDFLNRFKFEAKICASFAHPNIVTIYDYKKLSGHYFFSMFFVDGPTLTTFVKSQNIMSVHQICANIATICDAIGYAHQRGVIHRDVKASNIMLDRSGKPYITDFGIAKSELSQTRTQTDAIIGTPHYVSPEQVEGLKLDGRADIYSLGITLYALLTQRYPFQGQTVMSIISKRVTQEPIPPETYRPDLPPRLREILYKALQADRRHRYQTTSELANDLTEFVQNPRKTGQHWASSAPHVQQKLADPMQRRRVVIKWTMAAALVVAASLFVMLRYIGPAPHTEEGLPSTAVDVRQNVERRDFRYNINTTRSPETHQFDQQLKQLVVDIKRNFKVGDYLACIKVAAAANAIIDNLPADQKKGVLDLQKEIDTYKVQAATAIHNKERQLANLETIKKKTVDGRLAEATRLIDKMLAQTDLPTNMDTTLRTQRNIIQRKREVVSSRSHGVQQRDKQLSRLVVDVEQYFKDGDHSACLKAVAIAKAKIDSLTADQKKTYSDLLKKIDTYQLKADTVVQKRQRQLVDLEIIKKRVAEGHLEKATGLINKMLQQSDLPSDMDAALHTQRKAIQQKREAMAHRVRKAQQRDKQLNRLAIEMEQHFNDGDHSACLMAATAAKTRIDGLAADEQKTYLDLQKKIDTYQSKANTAVQNEQRQLVDIDRVKKKVADGHLDEAIVLIDAMLIQTDLSPKIELLLRSQRKIVKSISEK